MHNLYSLPLGILKNPHRWMLCKSKKWNLSELSILDNNNNNWYKMWFDSGITRRRTRSGELDTYLRNSWNNWKLYSKYIGMPIWSSMHGNDKEKKYRLDGGETFFKWYRSMDISVWLRVEYFFKNLHNDNERIFYHHVKCRVYLVPKKNQYFLTIACLGYISNWENIFFSKYF